MKKLLLGLCLCGLALAAEEPGVWLDVPFVKQEKNGCGAASISMVVQYWLKQQQNVPAETGPAGAPYSEKGRGIHASDMEHYFQEHGFRTFAFPGRWDDLKEHLQKGRPLIVALQPAPHSSELHYVVVSGLDWERGIVMLNDPAQRKLLQQERSAFEKQWNATGKWTLLAVPQPGNRAEISGPPKH